MKNFERKHARVQISISPELLKELDEFAADNYCTRSGVVCLAISQYMNAVCMGKAVEKLHALLSRIVSEGGSPDDVAQLQKITDAISLIFPDADLS